MTRADLVQGKNYKKVGVPVFFAVKDTTAYIGEDALKIRFDAFSYHIENISETGIELRQINTPHLDGVNMFIAFEDYIAMPERIENLKDYAYFVHGIDGFAAVPLRDITFSQLQALSALTGLSISEHADEISYLVKELISSLEEDAAK